MDLRLFGWMSAFSLPLQHHRRVIYMLCCFFLAACILVLCDFIWWGHIKGGLGGLWNVFENETHLGVTEFSRETEEEMEDDHVYHPESDNIWHNHMRDVGKERSDEGCYVCSLIPLATSTPRLVIAQEMQPLISQCLVHLTLCRVRSLFQGHTVQAVVIDSEDEQCAEKKEQGSYKVRPFLKLEGAFFLNNRWVPGVESCAAGGLLGFPEDVVARVNENCGKIWVDHVPKLTWIELNEAPAVILTPAEYSFCFRGNGTVHVGTNVRCNKTLFIPDLTEGTAALMNVYWVCGENAYIQLPPSWRGVCSLTTLHSPVLVVPDSHLSVINVLAPEPTKPPIVKRVLKRSHYLSKEDSERLNAISDQWQLFTNAETYFGSLLVPGETAANKNWLQVTRWEMLQMANQTEQGFNSVDRDMRDIMLMTFHNQYVLHLLKAMDEGICKKMGLSCCTYIPPNYVDNGSLSHVIMALQNLSIAVEKKAGVNPDGWFDAMFSWAPSWLEIAVKMLVPIVVFLLVMFCSTFP
ncbi:uncharacterized protein [Ambystoma mexicanum]|uniref:uncharacterized protein n=1 Tax=Ambystoma mexicanum TaxID=8296 RepID=UPI0037E74B6C